MVPPLATRGALTLAVLLAPTLATSVLAQGSITGFVVDSSGLPVANANIDVLGIDGNNDPIVSNDGTGSDGSFNVSVDPAGTYEVRFKPPAPPTTTHLIKVLPSIVIGSGTNLGNVALDPGLQLAGTVLSPGGSPLAGVNLDVRLDATGEDLVLQGDFTDAQGQLILAVPIEPFELRLDTTPVGTTIAPLSIDLDLASSTNLGNIQLDVGYLITAIVRNSSGAGIASADYDAHDSFSGKKLYTPGDNSNATGFVDFVVPAGTYDFDVCPPPGLIFVADLQPDVVVTGNTSFGIVTLQNGVLLSGTTFSHLAVPTPNVDLDVEVTGGGAEIPLCGDNSDATGAYEIVVPPGGTYRVTFDPPYSEPLGVDVHDPVFIGGNTVLDSNLPNLPFYTSSGSGTAGTGGLIPDLIAVGGTPRLGNSDYSLAITNARGGSKVLVSVGLGSCPANAGWHNDFATRQERLIVLYLSGTPGVPGAGYGELSIPIPPNSGFLGQSIYATARVIDPLAVGGLAWTPDFCTAVAP